MTKPSMDFGAYTSFDAESLRSYSSNILPDWASESGRESRTDRLLSDFPQPPWRSHNVDTVPENPAPPSPKPSVKTLRRNYMINEFPLLQARNPFNGTDEFNPISELGASYDLIAPYDGCDVPLHELEKMGDVMFSSEHMLTILNNPRYLARFREFLADERPRSLPTLTYYLNTRKALKAINYANALVRRSVDAPPPSVHTGDGLVGATVNAKLEERLRDALDALTAEELPAFITSRCITITSRIVEARVRGTLPPKFQGTSDGLAEVFCLTDPSRPDNPIIFASEEFHRTTQYGMDYVLGRNCRFLQGPKTNKNSVRRIREAIQDGRHHSELFLNYRRDGSPFMNLLQCAPLCDSHGQIRYFIGAQIDVSALAMEGAQLESLHELLEKQQSHDAITVAEKPKDEFRELAEMLSPQELVGVRAHGGDLFHPAVSHMQTSRGARGWMQPETLVEDDEEVLESGDIKPAFFRGSLIGAYENYLLVRPYPSLRILFTSPSLQIPGMLQSSFLSRIGSSCMVRDELVQAFMCDRSVTARIKWVTRYSPEGRNRWVHCTPLRASNGKVGVWMVVIVDDDD
ncbi:conserved hypothetical protein [Aspergillus terreus NIH2624]|uniref:PAC domain-containing protein n=1 Tax=Aspergillus terreus (strain NIH 2624 / FGSC A1156) TaxID=341663 RepID=Q0CEY5_ASPTN|nr:uncharacterized protein ATEG_07749 [Aspergillus terreus NIH2624]EAU32011.1 conserved hypothetical protein [Aspergillus terreus NIH2624]